MDATTTLGLPGLAHKISPTLPADEYDNAEDKIELRKHAEQFN
jgi:hypothetical protein